MVSEVGSLRSLRVIACKRNDNIFISEIVNRQVDQWLHSDIIEPCVSEWSSQVLERRKKDGSPHVRIDYRIQ